MANKRNTRKTVESIRHKDKRANIPTEELRDFVSDEELAPRTMLYPRDPSLDPQLVWKGKDKQDRENLAVPVVPVYIQEKIHPQAIIDALPRTERTGDAQTNLFADFNGLKDDFEKKVDFYSQKDDRQKPWSNRLILGDSLLVMTSLAEKEGLKGKVQAIYLDPPYGIKFGSNWQVSTRKRDVKDGKITGRYPPARTGARLPRHLEAGHPLLSGLPARPAGRWLAIYSPRQAVSSCRLEMRMSIWCGTFWMRCLGVRILSVSIQRAQDRWYDADSFLSGTVDFILLGTAREKYTQCKFRPLFLERTLRPQHTRSRVTRTSILYKRRPGTRHRNGQKKICVVLYISPVRGLRAYG